MDEQRVNYREGRHLAASEEKGQELNARLKASTDISKERQSLNSVIAAVGVRLKSTLMKTKDGVCSVAVEPKRQAFAWNSHRDTQYAHLTDGFEGVLHVFQQDWIGVRAASGSLPGQKLALAASSGLSPPAMAELVSSVMAKNPARIVIQGMSDTMGALVQVLAKAGWSDRLFIVLHGAPAQWFAPDESRYAFMCLDLARTEKIKRLHVMKPNFEFPGARLYKPMLFNLSPRIEKLGLQINPALAEPNRTLIPGWSGWRKNIHTNALGAALNDRVKEVWAFGGDLKLPEPLGSKIRIVPFQGREETFRLMAAAALVMNVSLVDCHPMVQVESQTLGRACLRGPLFLDALEEHPYVALTMVRDPTSAMEIRDVIERLLSVSAQERSELAKDYQRLSDMVAISRYREFLEV